MGILILAVLAMGVLTTGRWVVSFILPYLKRINAGEKPSSIAQTVVVLDGQKGIDFSGFETPSFLRRGMQYPILTEKKIGRKRKTKPVFAVA